MKIDFYSPKNYYGSHLFSLGGWFCLLLFIIMSPYISEGWISGSFFPAMILGEFFLLFLSLPLFFYILEWFFQSKVKNKFLLKNKVYDFFFDLGCVFYLLPVVWFFEVRKFRILPFAILIAIFVTIRTLKFLQDRRENKKKANDAQAEAVTPPPNSGVENVN